MKATRLSQTTFAARIFRASICQILPQHDNLNILNVVIIERASASASASVVFFAVVYPARRPKIFAKFFSSLPQNESKSEDQRKTFFASRCWKKWLRLKMIQQMIWFSFAANLRFEVSPVKWFFSFHFKKIFLCVKKVAEITKLI